MGRQPRRAERGMVTLTIRVPADVKNSLIDQADGNGLTMSEHITSLVRRERGDATE